MKFDVKFEEDILSQALQDTKFLKRAARTLESYHFSNRAYGWFWKVVKSCWDNHKEKPNAQYFLHKINSEFEGSEDRVKHIEVLKALLKKRSEVANIVLDELTEYVRMTKMHKSVETVIKHMEDDNIEGAYEVARNVVKADHKVRDYVTVSWVEEFEQRQSDRMYRKEHPEEFICVPTGIDKLDAIIGGLQPSEFGLVMATTGKGKSITLTNFLYHAAKVGYPVVYFALEMPASQIAQRLDSRWSGCEYDKFKTCDFTFEEIQSLEARHKKIHDNFMNKIKIISMPLRKCDINAVRNVLEDLAQEDDFIPQLVIVDSADHMQSANKGENYRVQQADPYIDLKDLAMEDGYAVWSSTQAGRDYADKIATAEATSENYDKARVADLILSINTPQQQTRATNDANDFSMLGDEFAEEEEPVLDIKGQHLDMYLAKYRDGVSKISIPLDADFARMLVRGAELL